MLRSISLLLLVVAASSGGLVPVPPIAPIIPLNPLVPTIPNAPLIPIPAPALPLPGVVGSTVNNVESTADNGVSLNNPLGSGTFMIGAMVLPVNALCVDTNLTKSVTCHVCFQDCLYVHNRYGGQCAYSAAAGEQRCTCYDDAFPTAADGTQQTTALELCEPLANSELTQILGPAAVASAQSSAVGDAITAVNTLADAAIRVAFVARYDYLQCSQTVAGLTGSDISVGCNADCTRNHQYVSTIGGEGKCALQPAVAPEANSASARFCTCGYDGPTGGSTYSSG